MQGGAALRLITLVRVVVLGWCLLTRTEAFGEGILFLRLQEGLDGMTLVGADLRQGRLRVPREELASGIRFRLWSLDGSELGGGVVADPRPLGGEYEDPEFKGSLVRQPVVDPVREFTLRVPFQDGGTTIDLWYQIERKEISASGSRRLADRFLGSFSLQDLKMHDSSRVSPQALEPATFKQIIDRGSKDSRINIVILSEGYRSSELVQFETDAKKLANSLLQTPPWSLYSSYFNVYAIAVASVESGSDHPSSGVYKETYFNSTFDSFGINRLLTIPPNDLNSAYDQGRGRVDALLKRFIPDYDLSLMLVNDQTYGGSGGTPAITSLNSSSAEILVHEIGHSYAGLGDEYDTPFPGYPDIEEPNTTREIRRELIKWNSWIAPETPVPTPELSINASRVGLFEGAHFHSTGWYRPKLNCKMNSLGVPFCEVCSEAHILRNYRLISPIESRLPAVAAVSLVGQVRTNFQVVPQRPSGHSLEMAWFVNGAQSRPADPNVLTVDTSELGNGKHEIRVVCWDPISRVRNDPQTLLRATNIWTINVSGVLPAIRLGGVKVGADGVVQLTVSSADVFGVSVEASTDVRVWELVSTVATHGISAVVLDPVGGGQRARYYRARRR